MKRPSFQFYPADWLADSKLKIRTHADKGRWIDLMCLLHQSDEYGVLRWPLDQIAKAVGARTADILRLCSGGSSHALLHGSNTRLTVEFIWTPSHAGQAGNPVKLIPAQQGPIWYSARMVRDEYKRQNAGKDTRFGSPSRREGESPSQREGESPTRRQGDGSASASAFASSPASINKTTPVEPPTEAYARPPQMRGFGKTTKSEPNPNWKVPSLDDQHGLDRFAWAHGVSTEKFGSYRELQQHLIALVKAENATRRSHRPKSDTH